MRTKLKCWFMLKFICSFKGHKDTPVMHHNGFKSGTCHTHKPVALYQSNAQDVIVSLVRRKYYDN